MKPQLKTEVAVVTILPGQCVISFYATPDAVSDFAQYGRLARWGNTDQYTLYVDARYDFEEVVAYIREYEEEDQ